MFYREKKARKALTLKALLQLRDLLWWAFKSFCFAGYTLWKAVQGSAGHKGVGRCPGTRADSKTWLLLKQALLDLRTMSDISRTITGSSLPEEEA